MVLFLRVYSLKRTVIREGEAKKTERDSDIEKGAGVQGDGAELEAPPESAEDDKTMKESGGADAEIGSQRPTTSSSEKWL
ncbi:hypothetical protein C0992_007218 [Termitomyces sp. T32_za158]|nr:hypothetical protein C0992_007218 [Termitomyces sp. T32_za158]